jgi:MFS family permease
MDKFFSGLTAEMEISSRRFVAVLLLISSSLAWFFLINMYFSNIFNSLAIDAFWTNVSLLFFYGFGAFSAFVGSSLSERIARRKLIGSWIALGVIITAFMPFFQGSVLALLLSILLGFSVGLGFPSAATILADATLVEERGRVSGLVILATFILTIIGSIVISILGTGLFGIILFCAIVRSVGFFPLVIDRCERRKRKKISWISAVTQKNFALYVIPWLLFNAAAGLLVWSGSALSQTPDLSAAVETGTEIGYVCTAFSGMVAGLIADRFGRKPPIFIALTLIGISFMLLGYVQISLTILIYYVFYGIAWGFLFSLYLTIPGDLSRSLSKEKFYALGTITPLLVWFILQSVPGLFNITIPLRLLSPLLGVILFLSIIPIFHAEETLPETKKRAREIKDYLDEKARKYGNKSD